MLEANGSEIRLKYNPVALVLHIQNNPKIYWSVFFQRRVVELSLIWAYFEKFQWEMIRID